MEDIDSELKLTEQIQQYVLNMLCFFNSYAQEHNITYYMAGGTLLGAVRHKGFIPWDDDVDLMLPRNDYEKLLNSFENGRYHLSSCDYEADYNTPFARLWDTKTSLEWNIIKDKKIGIFIDLFPIDGFPKGKIRSKIHLLHLKIIRSKINSSIRLEFLDKEKYRFVKCFMKKVFHKSGNYYSKRLNTVAKKFDFSKCKYVGVKTTTDHLFKEENDKKIFSETMWMIFENLTLPAPSGYDIYLRHLYGKYMELPSKKDQHSKHQFVIKFD